MKIFIGADHRGVGLKAEIAAFLREGGHEVVDVGTQDAAQACDYPGISHAVARSVAENPGARGMLVCMTGIGHSIAANKVPGAYAALCYNRQAAALSRQHNNANILVLGALFVPPEEVREIIATWLASEFEGGRHARRVEQIKAIEAEYTGGRAGH